MMKIVQKRLGFFIISIILAVVCIVALAVSPPKSGVEFASGSILSISFEKPVAQDAVKIQMDSLGYKNALINSAGSAGTDFIIRTTPLDEAAKTKVVTTLTNSFGALKVNEFDNISPMIASETTRNAGIAVIIAIVAMLLYIAFAFRKMPNPFRYGFCAVIGLAFDILIVLGVYSIMGAILGWEIDLMFVAGLLAVLGFSINNTIIVFDRIRENMGKGFSKDFEEVVNFSIVETLGRSFNSSLTALITLVVLALFVGASIQNFVIVLMIGVISGVYTSTFLSPELLVAWRKRNTAGAAGSKGNNLAAVKARS
jgi:preprotein translocase subunit SecF